MRVGSGLRASASALSLSMVLASAAIAQDLKSVPRNRTLISQGWDYYNQVPSPTNLSPYPGLLLHQRNSLHYTVNEMLFYTNHRPTRSLRGRPRASATTTLHRGDGQDPRQGEVERRQALHGRRRRLHLDMLKSVAPDLSLSSAIKEWVAKAEAPDPRTVKITLTKPGPRWVQDILAQGQAGRASPSCPSISGRARIRRPSRSSTRKRAGPSAQAPTSWSKSEFGLDRLRPPRLLVGAWTPGSSPAMPAIERSSSGPPRSTPCRSSSPTMRSISAAPCRSEPSRLPRAAIPGLVSWNKEGPVWGAPDGCTFRLVPITRRRRSTTPDVRRAINAAIDRDQLIDLAYEGSMPAAVMPFASYGGVVAYTRQMKDLVDKSGVGKHDRSTRSRSS